MASGVIEGKFLGMNIDGQWTPCEISCSIRMENELLIASSETKGNWRSYIEGYKGWSMSVNGRLLINNLSSSFNNIFLKNILAQQTFQVLIGTYVGSEGDVIIIKGTARIQDLDLIANVESKAEYNINFLGDGPLTQVEFEEFLQLIINANPIGAAHPIIYDTRSWS